MIAFILYIIGLFFMHFYLDSQISQIPIALDKIRVWGFALVWPVTAILILIEVHT